MTLSADTGLSRSAAEFYNELIAGGMIKPSEQCTFNTTEKLSLGGFKNSIGMTEKRFSKVLTAFAKSAHRCL